MQLNFPAAHIAWTSKQILLATSCCQIYKQWSGVIWYARCTWHFNLTLHTTSNIMLKTQVISFDHFHSFQTLRQLSPFRLFWALCAQAAAQQAMVITDQIFVGMLGSQELAAAGVASSWWAPSMCLRGAHHLLRLCTSPRFPLSQPLSKALAVSPCTVCSSAKLHAHASLMI